MIDAVNLYFVLGFSVLLILWSAFKRVWLPAVASEFVLWIAGIYAQNDNQIVVDYGINPTNGAVVTVVQPFYPTFALPFVFLAVISAVLIFYIGRGLI